MKKMKWFGIIFSMILVFALGSCEQPTSGKEKDKNLDLSGTLTVNPNPAETGDELTAAYSGDEIVAYQWYKDGTAVEGAVLKTLIPETAGTYKVTVSKGGYNSKSVEIIVTGDPLLPGTVSISPVEDVTVGMELTASYDGDETITWQWNKDGEIIQGANSKAFTPAVKGSYTVTATAEGFKSKTSESVTVAIGNLTGEVVINPYTDVKVKTELHAEYNGHETINFWQWYKDGIAIEGADSETFTPTEAGNYTVEVNAQDYNSKTSTAVIVSLLDFEGTLTISPNTNVVTWTELSASYTGNETGISGQWYKDGELIEGANSDTFTPTEAGSYRVTISAEGYNSKTSDTVIVSLANLAGTLTITPNTNVVAGTELSASYTGNETGITFQWYRDGELIEGADSDTFTPTKAGSYRVTISAEGYNSKTSDAVEVMPNPLMTLTRAKWEEILADIDTYLTGDGELDLSKYLPGTVPGDTLNNTGSFRPIVFDSAPDASTLRTQAKKIKKLIIPDAATAITMGDGDESTPYDLSELTEVEGAEIITIGGSAFRYHTKLVSASFPKATVIGIYAFTGCTALESIDLPKVTAIGEGAFLNCSSLTAVSFPEATILREATVGGGTRTFGGCTALISIELPAAENIPNFAFDGSRGLESISLGTTAPSVGREPFRNIVSPQTITVKVPAGAVGYNDAWITAFKGGNTNITVVIEEI